MKLSVIVHDKTWTYLSQKYKEVLIQFGKNIVKITIENEKAVVCIGNKNLSETKSFLLSETGEVHESTSY